MEKVRTKLYGEYDPYYGLDQQPLDMQGWATSDSPAFDELINQLKPKLIIEVGSWKGRSAIRMAQLALQHHDDIEIVCIDTWLGSYEHWVGIDKSLEKNRFQNGRPDVYQKFLSNVVHNNLQKYITPFPIDSINGALTLENFGTQADLIYVDAGHESISVRIDLCLYSSLVRAGGCLLGDDFFHPPVKSAAYETFGEDKVIKLSEDKFLWIK